MEPDEELALAVMVVAEQRARRVEAAKELAQVGIRSATDADVDAWLAATSRQRRSLSLAWAVLAASPEPEWKSIERRSR